MIHEDLQKNPDLIAAIVGLSGLKNIKIENITSVESGSRSWCYIVKNTEVGDIFCKIEDDISQVNFLQSMRNENLTRQKAVMSFQEAFSASNKISHTVNSSTTCPSILENANDNHVYVIPPQINGISTPKNLIGKCVTFMEKINAIDFECANVRGGESKWDKYYMKKFSKTDIELMMSSVASVHKFAKTHTRQVQSKTNECLDIPAYAPFYIPSKEEFSRGLMDAIGATNITESGTFTLSGNSILNTEKTTQHEAKKIQSDVLRYLSSQLDTKDCRHNNTADCCNADHKHNATLNDIKDKFANVAMRKFKIIIDCDSFHRELLKYSSKINADLLTCGKKIIFLNSLENLSKCSNQISQLTADTLQDLSNKWEDICKLPESINHNDVLPPNFMKSPDGKKTYIIDFGSMGKNKKIIDLGFVVMNNFDPDDDVLKAMVNGYRVRGGGSFSHDELSLLYDVDRILVMNDIINQVNCVKHVLKTQDYSIVTKPFNVYEDLAQLQNLKAQSRSNNLNAILTQTQNEMLNGLDLASPTCPIDCHIGEHIGALNKSRLSKSQDNLTTRNR